MCPAVGRTGSSFSKGLVCLGIQLSHVRQLLLVFSSCKKTPNRNSSFSLLWWCCLLNSSTWLLVHHRSQRPNAQPDGRLWQHPVPSEGAGRRTEGTRNLKWPCGSVWMCVFCFLLLHGAPRHIFATTQPPQPSHQTVPWVVERLGSLVISLYVIAVL